MARLRLNNKEIIPTMGHIVIELIEEKKEDYVKAAHEKKYKDLLPADSKLIIPDLDDHSGRVPLRQGKVIDMAQDAFGERFKHNYGSEGERPNIGDIVMFAMYQQYNLDIKGKYALISDERIFCILREVINDE